MVKVISISWVAIIITICIPTRRSILVNIYRYSTVITYGEGEPIDACISP